MGKPASQPTNQPLWQQSFQNLASTPQVLTAHEELRHLFIRQVRDLAVPAVDRKNRKGCHCWKKKRGQTHTHTHTLQYTLWTLFLKFISNLLFVWLPSHNKFCWVRWWESIIDLQSVPFHSLKDVIHHPIETQQTLAVPTPVKLRLVRFSAMLLGILCILLSTSAG